MAASSWRIRHKLLLGLGLVVGIMALLLGGTLRGLWSYYLTTNGIRAKLQELSAAEDLKGRVAELVSPGNKALLHPVELPEQIKKVRNALDLYDQQLDESLVQTRDPREGAFEKEWIDCILKHLDNLQGEAEAHMTRARGGPIGDGNRQEEDEKALAEPKGALYQVVIDLRDHIKQELEERLKHTRKHYQDVLWIVVPSSVAGLLLMLGLMRSFYAWVFYPIRDVEAGVSKVAAGDFHHRIELTSGDEMEDLARAFNDMLGRLQALYDDLARQVNERSRQLVRSERLASVGFLAAGVAHEINNPLASIAFCGEALEARLTDLARHLRHTPGAAQEHDIFSKYLKMIQDEAFRCKNITERLLEFSRTGEPRREPTEIRALVQAVLDVTQHLPNHKGKHITFEVPSERAGGRVMAWVNGEEIKSVILNLVVNALESMDEDGRLTIRLAQREGMAELRFSDTGCGMTPDVLENIFEPFFTRSRSGKGTGLGLTISHLIISQHGGEIEAGSAGLGQGSTFLVRLPVQARESAGEWTIGAERPAARPLAAGRAA